MKRILCLLILVGALVVPSMSFADDISGVYIFTAPVGDGVAKIAINSKGNNAYNVTIDIVAKEYQDKFEGNGKLADTILVVKDKKRTLKIYTKQHKDVIRYADDLLDEGKKEENIDYKKFLLDEGNNFKNWSGSKVVIIDPSFAGIYTKTDKKK